MRKNSGNGCPVNMERTKIALCGATSHIAKGLIYNFIQLGGFHLHLYTRSIDPMDNFLKSIGKTNCYNCDVHVGYKDFMQHDYDVVINCVGVGTMNKLQGNYAKYFMVGEEYDNLIIGYLYNRCPDTLYISFSSGAVYGRGYSAPVEENTKNSIPVNHITVEDYYTITRLNSEAKHRALKGFRIVDLRVFSYFSRFIDLNDEYFIAEVINCTLKKKVLVTDNMNIIRDYAHPKDLFGLITKCLDTEQINVAFDVNSSKPVEKREILDYFSSEYGLKYITVQNINQICPTGMKKTYCSNYDNSSTIGHRPEFSSMETISQEAEYIL
jgi:nucleoside-diphosphate-sugar epimerase